MIPMSQALPSTSQTFPTSRILWKSLPRLYNAHQRIDLSTEFSGLTEGIDGLFTIIDTAVDTIAFAAKLPVIGDQLRSAADFLTKVRNETKRRFSKPDRRH